MRNHFPKLVLTKSIRDDSAPRMVDHGELKVKRRYFGMMAVGGRYPQIMAFGGKNITGNLEPDHVQMTKAFWRLKSVLE